MTQDIFARTRLLLGPSAIETLNKSRVAVFGLGGVGSYAVEVLARSGVGELDLIDNDTVCLSNINRQLYALHSTLGRYKVDVAAERIRDINPQCTVHTLRLFYLPENADAIDLSSYSYVVDCIDTVKAKLELVRRCHLLNVPVISCMGAANKLDPAAFRVTDISKTKMDPLAKVMRCTLRKEGITHLKVVYSEEPPLPPVSDPSAPNEGIDPTACGKRRGVPASNAFVPAAAGLLIGSVVVKDILGRAGLLRATDKS